MLRTILTVVLVLALSSTDAWCTALCAPPSTGAATAEADGGGTGPPCHRTTPSDEALSGETARNDSRNTTPSPSPSAAASPAPAPPSAPFHDDCAGCDDDATAEAGPAPTAQSTPTAPCLAIMPSRVRVDPRTVSTRPTARAFVDRAPPRAVLSRTTTLLL